MKQWPYGSARPLSSRSGVGTDDSMARDSARRHKIMMTYYENRLRSLYQPECINEYRGKDNGFSEPEIARQLVARGKDLSRWLWANVDDGEGNYRQVIWEWELGGPVMIRLDVFQPECDNPQLGYMATYLRGRLNDGLFCPFKAAETEWNPDKSEYEHAKTVDQFVKASWDIQKAGDRWLEEIEGNQFPVYTGYDLDIAEDA